LQELIIENISVIDIAESGHGIGKSEGLVIFIEQAVPGDILDARIFKKKKNLAYASIHSLKTPSVHRELPFCKHFGVCGGCKWQHIKYSEQLVLKQKSVCDALDRIGGLDTSGCEPILPSANNQYYRNKLEYTFSHRAWLATYQKNNPIEQEEWPQALGFHVPGGFAKVLDIEECFLQTKLSDEIRNTIREFALKHNYTFYNIRKHAGELRNLIVRTSSGGEMMVAMVFAYADKDRIKLLMNFLKEKFSQITSLLYIENQKKNDTVFDQVVNLYSGEEHIFEYMPRLKQQEKTLKFKIGLKSFYQTNSQQAHELYKIIAEFADLQGNELVYDLYTGAGTIANFIAESAKKVIGIDYIPSAIEDANLNSKENEISNTKFFSGDMKDILDKNFVIQNGHPDVIILDPPRAGLHPSVVACLLAVESKKIVYVSCNASTQARDLALLKQKYNILRIKPVDMFPHTQHVENVVALSLK